ncbi:MAG: metallophosphoesterase family protein, partial [Solirubrobacteraceae bacterium]
MRILHTADWHIGRTFHGHATLGPLRDVLGAIPDIVRKEHVDLVLVAGDVFDSAAPSGDAFALLRDALVTIREAGAEVILISGNHDSAARLGFAAPFATLAGVHFETDPDTIDQPIAFEDQHGLVDVYCVPFLEPALLRSRWQGAQIRNQADALRHAMGQIRTSVATRAAEKPRRKVVVAHTFAAGAQSES